MNIIKRGFLHDEGRIVYMLGTQECIWYGQCEQSYSPCKKSRERGLIWWVWPQAVCGQICLILHRVPEGNQLCLGSPVPLPLGLPAEGSSIVKTVRQLVQPCLGNAPQVLDMVQISAHDMPQHCLDVALPLDCLGDLGSLSRGVVLLDDQWVVTCVERHMDKPQVLCDVAVGDHSS